MFRNYFKIGWRSLIRHKAYTFINLVGLSMGMACAILLFSILRFQLSFDTFHQNKDRIYRIVTELHDERTGYAPAVPQPLGKAFRKDFAFAERTARVVVYRNTVISLPGGKEIKKFQEERGVAFAEPAFFDIFSFPLLYGDRRTALLHPYSAIITQNLAKKYFGSGEAIGKTLRLDNKTDFRITGILKDIPANTDRKEEIYLSYDNLMERNSWFASDSSWSNIYSGSMCFILLKPNVVAAEVNKVLPLLSNKYYKGREAKIFQFRLQPLSDIHFNNQFDGYADKKYLWALGIIGLLLVITACVNFINLATAQALNRSKEVGIRKVLGSLRSQLFWQFISETALITLASLLIAYGLCQWALPSLNHLLRSEMDLQLLTNWQLPAFLLSLIVFVIFLSGAYPGLVLARFQPVLALKTKLSHASIGGFSLRRILVIAQFTITQMLIIGTIVIASQVHYSTSSSLGFDKEALVMLPIPVNDKMRMTTLRNRLSELPGVEKISLCMQPPASANNNNSGVRFDTRPQDEHWSVNTKPADEQYLSTFGLKLTAGRNFYPSDTVREFLVNETFVKKLNLNAPGEVIGRQITINGGSTKGTIVGVVKDFYNYSFHQDISPICIMPDNNQFSTCSIKLNPHNTRGSLASFEKIWNEVYPEYIYSYNFLDDQVAQFYLLDNILLTLIEVFAGMAILIGSLGLFGLVSFMAVSKIKEIGIRKVLGAGLGQILWLFGKEFGRLLLIAFLLAAPIAWWAMNFYLQSFKYRIPLGAGIFAIAILITFLIAGLTVGYRSVRSALANPVDSLRSE